MTEEKKDNEAYIEKLRSNTNFVEGGAVDEDGFYIQIDGSKWSKSIVGYFDPEGVFFDEHGYDEFGGYYDDDGVYREADYEKEYDEELEEEAKQHKDYLNNCIETSNENNFKGMIMNIVDKVTEKEVKDELEKLSKDFGTVNIHKEEDDTQTALVEVKSKEAAKAMISLHTKKMFGDKIDIDFEEFMNAEAHPPEPSKEDDIKKNLEEEGYEVEVLKKG